MNIQENITKFTDLQNNDSLSSFMNHASQQSHNVYQIFYDFISDVKPKRILEIGTALGGFTQFLNIIIKELNLDTKILTYDIISHPWYQEIINEGIDLRVEDIFSDNFKTCKQEVIDFINESGITLVLCDGGWKIGEFNLLSDYIKSGDYIMAHDYSFDEETYKNEIYNKIWNWCEITEKDIQECSLRNNLTPYNHEIFSKCVWVCKKKL
jgi:hypothetical protein